ncbi:MAG: hypothetical protein WB586_08625 [Chthoniobacterales bacterium]
MNPAPKGDPTGKYTLNGWGQTEADFAFFDLAQDKVELKSDGWRTEKIADDPNVYFDSAVRPGSRMSTSGFAKSMPAGLI